MFNSFRLFLRGWIRPYLLGFSRVGHRVKAYRVEVINRSPQTALDHPVKSSGCEVPAWSVQIEAAEGEPGFIITTAEIGIEASLNKARAELPPLQPFAADPCLVMADVVRTEDKASLNIFG